jgi:hypothetical protein
MADNDVEVGPDEVLVERKIVPAQRRGISLWGAILMIAFVATCVSSFSEIGWVFTTVRRPPWK